MTELDKLLALRESIARMSVDNPAEAIGEILAFADTAATSLPAIATHVRAQADRIGELERSLLMCRDQYSRIG